jgi:hypothetical protein
MFMKFHYVIENFASFLKSIKTLNLDERLESYEYRKLMLRLKSRNGSAA